MLSRVTKWWSLLEVSYNCVLCYSNLRMSSVAKGGEKLGVSEEDRLSPQEYYANRVKAVDEKKSLGLNPYPHKFNVSHTVKELIDEYVGKLGDGERLENVMVSVAGRVIRLAASGVKLRFYDLRNDGEKIQIMSNANVYEKMEEFESINNEIRRGDIIGVDGYIGKSKRGELSVFAKKIVVLSPCLKMLPVRNLKDQETRYRQRYLDLIVNDTNRKTFEIRSKILSFIRKFLEKRNFLEVETPMMTSIPGGAAARPFKTYHNELEKDLFMRIAPELFLKMLIVGGLERVFEIGKNFRNEGIDLTHNPEFTSCEFYMAYADYNDLMDLTEELVSSLVLSIHGEYKVKFQPLDGDEKMLDFTPPYRRVSLITEIERNAYVTIPEPYDSDECIKFCLDLLEKNHIEIPKPPTPAKLLDQLCGYFVESKICEKPVFIIDHPQIMSPLAKWHRSNNQLTERFELFLLEKELCNAYTELNDPFKQRECFLDQAKAINQGDNETCPIDEVFCTSLEYGLPPTGGWGLGIDRLTMFLANKNNIKEVILFPAMRENIQPHNNNTHEKTENHNNNNKSSNDNNNNNNTRPKHSSEPENDSCQSHQKRHPI